MTDRLDGKSPATGTAKLPCQCAICNSGLALEALCQPGRVCDHCAATRQSIELTEALLATIGRGVQPFLYRMAFEEPTRSARVLDLSGDRALAQVFWVVDNYRAGRQLRGGSASPSTAQAEEFDLFAEPARSIDLLILRNSLFAAEDLPALLDAIAEVLAPGGWVIVQERFLWPLPAETVPSPTPEEVTTRAIGGGAMLPEHYAIGGDIVDMLAGRGIIGEFYRPNHGLDPLFRNAVFTGLKVDL